jgi:hypothetical protein
VLVVPRQAVRLPSGVPGPGWRGSAVAMPPEVFLEHLVYWVLTAMAVEHFSEQSLQNGTLAHYLSQVVC